jgi:sulfate adenylyltransferase subunit 1
MTITQSNSVTQSIPNPVLGIEQWLKHQGAPALFFISNRDKVLHAAIVSDLRLLVETEIRKFTQLSAVLGVPNIVYAFSNLESIENPEDQFQKVDKIAKELAKSSYQLVPVADSDLNIPQIEAWHRGISLQQIHTKTRNINTNEQIPLRIPISEVAYSDETNFAEYRYYAGSVSGGSVKVGDTILALPINRIATVKLIVENRRAINRAHSGQFVQIYLDAPLPVRAGDMLVKLNVDYPRYSSTVSILVHLQLNENLRTNRSIKVKHSNETIDAQVHFVKNPIPVEDESNWAVVTIKTSKPLKFDSYVDNCTTGSIELFDHQTNSPIGFGLIIAEPELFSYNI